jgi:hypothetical protein
MRATTVMAAAMAMGFEWTAVAQDGVDNLTLRKQEQKTDRQISVTFQRYSNPIARVVTDLDGGAEWAETGILYDGKPVVVFSFRKDRGTVVNVLQDTSARIRLMDKDNDGRIDFVEVRHPNGAYYEDYHVESGWKLKCFTKEEYVAANPAYRGVSASRDTK